MYKKQASTRLLREGMDFLFCGIAVVVILYIHTRVEIRVSVLDLNIFTVSILFMPLEVQVQISFETNQQMSRKKQVIRDNLSRIK